MPSTTHLDACGRRRSPATLPSFHRGRTPRNKSRRYLADPPSVEEIIAVMHAVGEDHDAIRLRGLIVVRWRAGLRISEALALTESDLDLHRGAILVRRGKGGKRREVGMDRWAWEQLTPWLQLRTTLPVGALFCVLRGPTAGRPWAPAGVRSQLHQAAARAGVRRRFAPHQLRHAHRPCPPRQRDHRVPVVDEPFLADAPTGNRPGRRRKHSRWQPAGQRGWPRGAGIGFTRWQLPGVSAGLAAQGVATQAV
jgi:integrase